MRVGYYVHHVGHGHLHRATALARHLAATGGATVTGLSSLPRPADWPGPWVELARDDRGPAATGPALTSTTAGGRLHWAPAGDEGLLDRTARVSAWLEQARPDVVVVDQDEVRLARARQPVDEAFRHRGAPVRGPLRDRLRRRPSRRPRR